MSNISEGWKAQLNYNERVSKILEKCGIKIKEHTEKIEKLEREIEKLKGIKDNV